MTDTAAPDSRRLYAMLSRLANSDYLQAQELADTLGVSREMLVNDLASLVDRYAIRREGDEWIEVFLDGPHVAARAGALRSLKPSMWELCGLELGLALARCARAPSETDAIDRALARLRSVMSRLPSHDEDDELDEAEEDSTQSAPDDDRATTAEGGVQARIRYSKAMALFMRRSDGVRLPDGSLEVTYPGADMSLLIQHVLISGPEAEVIEPPEARAEVMRMLTLMGEEPPQASSTSTPEAVSS